MAHENCVEHYSDWDTKVYCSFSNVFTPTIAHIVGGNLQKILGISHFQPDVMAKESPAPYHFTCKRKEANSIRDQMIKITTESYSYIWFSMQTDPFHFLYNRRSMLTDNSIQVKDFLGYFYFGSMYSYDTFIIHSEQHPIIHNFRILKWKEQPETIRIMLKDKSRQIFIPIKWIQKSLLVNITDRPSIVFMLKYSVKMKKTTTVNNQSTTERICKIGENEFETIVSKSSDLMISFVDIEHTWAFLNELTHETNEYRNKFTINFLTLKQNFKKETNPSFYLPSTALHKQHYALKMLFSMGYLFQDKYFKQLHEQFIRFNKDSFNDLCYYLKDKLTENHCYRIKNIFQDFNNYIKDKQILTRKKDLYCVGCISLTPLRILYQRMEETIGNRALRMNEFGGEDMFLLVHIREEDNEKLKDFDSTIKRRLKSKMFYGIKIMNKTYRLFGTSTSQLKEMSFWFISIENKSIEDAWKHFGNFSQIKNIANYIARIGLYFTTSYQTGISFKYLGKSLSKEAFTATLIDDIESEDKKYCFTDGVGKMSWGIAGLVALKLNIQLQSRYDIPSAYQVRIAGCKGMLAIDPQSTLDQYYIQIRDSMLKFQSDKWDLEITQISKPLELKFNNQIIMLLSDLGNKDAVFLSYQNAAMTHLFQQNQNEQIRKLKYSLAKDDLLKNKIPLPMNEARNMFGLVDETGLLEYGQVFIQYKDFDTSNENIYKVVTGEVLVAKNPCLHPGDFRKLTAINVPQLRTCIRDCIVFPRKGPRPHPNEMSGSDLDGDQYWIYWGKDLKIRQMDEPLSYEASPKKLVSKIDHEIIIDHIIESFGAGSQGIICDVHLAIADSHLNHTRSLECKYLAELFARAVDAPKSGEIIDLDRVYELRAKYCRSYPQFMKKYDQPIRESNSILNKLFLQARHHFFSERPSISSTQFPIVTAKADGQRKLVANVQDDEFQNWLASHNGIQRAEDNNDESQPALVNTSTTNKPQIIKSFQSLVKQQPTETSIKQPKKTTSKKVENIESEYQQASSGKGKRASIDVKFSELLIDQSTEASGKQTKKSASKIVDDHVPVIKEKKSSLNTKTSESEKSKEIKTKEESIDNSKILINSAASSVTSKLSSTASSLAENLSNRNIVFNGMTTITNRLKWKLSNNGLFIVSLDTKSTGEYNVIDKLIQLMIDAGKTSSIPSNTKLTLIISWGTLFLQISSEINDTKPKNIKELNQCIKETNNIEFSFEEHDMKTIIKGHEPSKKSTAEYILLCKSPDNSSNDIAIVFDEKKRLKRFLLNSTCWNCIVRGGEQLFDSLYEIRSTIDEIDSKNELFTRYLKLIFNDPNTIDLLSGISPRISIDNQLLKPTIQIISLKRIIRYDFDNFIQQQFNTLENLTYVFYQVTHISIEKIKGKIETHDTIEFHATQIQISNKHEQDLKQLSIFAEKVFN